MAGEETLLMVRALMRRLWQFYDAGGHSMGRSDRSKLLEAAIGIFPSQMLPEFPDDTAETFQNIRDLYTKNEGVECASAVLSELTPEMYATLVAKTLESLTRKEIHPSIIHENLIRTMLYLLNGKLRIQAYRDRGGRKVLAEDLIEEGRRRAGLLREQKRGP